jgi:hypothetical protein
VTMDKDGKLALYLQSMTAGDEGAVGFHSIEVSEVGESAAAPPEKTWTDGPPLYALDLSKQQPFEVDGTNTGMANKTGPGDFPDGWSVKTWNPDYRGKGFADTAKGAAAIGAKPLAGSAILFSPDLDFKGKFVKLRFEYQSSASERLCTVRVREQPKTDTVNANLPPTETWKTFERVYDVSAYKGAIRVEFHNSDKGTELRLRSFQVLETEEKK